MTDSEVGGVGALCTEDTRKQTLNLCCFKIFIYLQDSAVSRCVPGRENICRVPSAPQKCGTGRRKIGGSVFLFFSARCWIAARWCGAEIAGADFEEAQGFWVVFFFTPPYLLSPLCAAASHICHYDNNKQ